MAFIFFFFFLWKQFWDREFCPRSWEIWTECDAKNCRSIYSMAEKRVKKLPFAFESMMLSRMKRCGGGANEFSSRHVRPVSVSDSNIRMSADRTQETPSFSSYYIFVTTMNLQMVSFSPRSQFSLRFVHRLWSFVRKFCTTLASLLFVENIWRFLAGWSL